MDSDLLDSTKQFTLHSHQDGYRFAAEESYTKHDHSRWTYASGNFSADLVVDELGVVIDYGDLLSLPFVFSPLLVAVLFANLNRPYS